MPPGYVDLHARGVLQERARQALDRLRRCELCPRLCGVNRWEDERGVCRTGRRALVSSYNPHFGEESPLVGSGGSGTIFFTHCNLLCTFCQNYEISHLGEGREVSPHALARMMLALQEAGCHNVNFVTPSHVVAQILEALPLAVEGGLGIPLVYNTGGYDRVDTLRILDGIVDIFMPDVKFLDGDLSNRLCKAPDYPERVREGVKEMHRQVGDLALDPHGVARRGLLIRHLVMPGGLGQTQEVMAFLAGEISTDTYVNIMDQYRPCGEAHTHRDLSRRITGEEYERAVAMAKAQGLLRLDSRVPFRILRSW